MMTVAAKSNPLSVPEAYDQTRQYLAGTGTVNSTLEQLFDVTDRIDSILEQLVADLESHAINYVVIGGLATFAHGFRRVTNNIDIALTAEGSTRSGKVQKISFSSQFA